MADFNEPKNETLAENVLTYVKAQILSVAKMFIGTSDTNVPDGVVCYNETSKKFQKKNGASWDNLNFHSVIDDHITDTTIHDAAEIGDYCWSAKSSKTGWLKCDGSAVSRTTYDDLFGVVGTAFGVGDGSTTFNLPNALKKVLVPVGSGLSLGDSGGSWDHTHTQPTHTHTVPAHTHGLASHTHTVVDHVHTGPAHDHTVAGHKHAKGSLAVGSSGSHTHNVGTHYNATLATSSGNRAAQSQAGNAATITSVGDGGGSHTHANSSFSGYVGNTSGSDGDSAITTSSSGTGSTGSGGAQTSSGPSSANSDSGGSGTSGSGGNDATGTNNQAYLCFGNLFIKY